MTRATFTGNGAYCYANAPHMTFLTSGADMAAVPEPGFLECATAMPFGRVFHAADQPTFWPSAPSWSPERGLEHALTVLGWQCQTWYGGEPAEAVVRLREVLLLGPALIGPVDFGYLSYSPASGRMAGADHYIMALAFHHHDEVLVHDPAGYPYAILPVADLLAAWKAERIHYRQGSYTLRGCFRRERSVSRQDVIQRTLPLARALMRSKPIEPTSFGGAEALRHLAEWLRTQVPAVLRNNLLGFSLPTAARRAADAARFLEEGEQPEAAGLMEREAILWGKALSLAARDQWAEVALAIDELAAVEHELECAL